MSGCHPVCVLSYVFFSSRRRHTRFDCDWSSDVCSSDCSWRPICVAPSNGENFAISINRLLHSLPEKLPALRLCCDGSIQLAGCSDRLNLSPLLKKRASYASWAGGICGRPAGKSASGEQV